MTDTLYFSSTKGIIIGTDQLLVAKAKTCCSPLSVGFVVCLVWDHLIGFSTLNTEFRYIEIFDFGLNLRHDGATLSNLLISNSCGGVCAVQTKYIKTCNFYGTCWASWWENR